MKKVAIFIICALLSGMVHSQQIGQEGTTLLWVGSSSTLWNDSLNWKQINIPADQTPVHKVPTELDDVVFSKSMSGLSTVTVFVGDSSYYSTSHPYLVIGRSDSTGFYCRSMHVSGTNLSLIPEAIDMGFFLNVYTAMVGM
ncbi:MAG TPA: hypothetical protein VMU83_13110 [Hanamia sp.]|nr:hypothetical protein [Hanamia sp.]